MLLLGSRFFYGLFKRSVVEVSEIIIVVANLLPFLELVEFVPEAILVVDSAFVFLCRILICYFKPLLCPLLALQR